MNYPKVAVIVLNWNGCEDTLACLKSLNQLRYPNTEIIVVDNGSTDDSVEVVKKHFPDIPLIENHENLGFVGGNNIGLDVAERNGADYVLLLNNDTEVAPDLLHKLVEVADVDPRIGMVGPTIYYFDRPNVIWSAGGGIDWKRGRTWMIGLDESDDGQFGTKSREVDFVTGCCLLVKMAIVEQIGKLDPLFFAYYEETEWCIRAIRAGYRVLHIPQAKVWHKIYPAEQTNSPIVHYYMTRNRLLFLKTVNAGWQAWMYTLIFDYLRTLTSWTLRPKWRRKRKQRDVMLRAVVDFFRGRFGRATPVVS